MREHCRTQHDYDPEPIRGKSPGNQYRVKGVIGSPVDATSPEAVQALFKMIDNSLRFQQIGVVDDTGEQLSNSGSAEDSLNYFLDKFVLLRKKEFQGISGHFCKNCLSFQYRYVKNIWDEKTAKDLHIHTPNMPYDANRAIKEKERLMQANSLLIELTNSLFGAYRYFAVHPCIELTNFHGPVSKFNYLDQYHWAGMALVNKGQIPSDSVVNNFIINVGGTYAQFVVASGPLVGRYVVFIQASG